MTKLYVVIYMFRVRKESLEAFLRIQAEVAAIYKAHGALEDITYAPADLTPKYGCTGFPEVLAPAPDEAVLVEITSFRDRAHHDEVMARIDADERVLALYREVTGIVDVARVVRGEFKRAV